MLELGQPLHAYDDRLLDGDIVVRFATRRRGADAAQRPGAEARTATCCWSATRRSRWASPASWAASTRASTTRRRRSSSKRAFWNPAVIQGKSRRLGFASDAGYRFERGVDFDGCVARARARDAADPRHAAAAAPARSTIVAGALPRARAGARAPARVARLLGVDAARRRDRRAVRSAADSRTSGDGDDLVVTPPSYRFDLAIEEDFVEEVARLHGYDAIPAAPAAHVQQHAARARAARGRRARSSARLAARDWQEVITFSFVARGVEAALDPGRDADARRSRC